jgi:hypothetical protein
MDERGRDLLERAVARFHGNVDALAQALTLVGAKAITRDDIYVWRARQVPHKWRASLERVVADPVAPPVPAAVLDELREIKELLRQVLESVARDRASGPRRRRR